MRRSPPFAMRLEGTLNQIQLQCPRRMTDLEAQQHLKDHLFHGVHNHICDSIQYLHSIPGNEETQDKVRARATVTTDPGGGMTKLGQQIAKLMATLTQIRQDSGPSSVPGSPSEWGH